MKAGGVAHVGVAVAVALVGVLAVWVAYGPSRLPDAIPHATAGFVAITCGAIASVRVRWSHVGMLLLAMGLTWFGGDFAACMNIEPLAHRCLDPGLLGDVAGALSWLWIGVLVHIVVAFPDGRLRDTWRRAAVASGYAIVVLLGLAGAAPSPAELLGARVAVPIMLAVASLVTLAALLAAEAGRADLTPDRAVGLGRALATALGDPRFRIAFAEPGDGGWLDASGHAVPPPAAAAGLALTPVTRGGLTLALIEHDPATLLDPQVRSSVVVAVELAAHNSRLRAELDAQLGEVAASRRRLVDAAIDERRELAAQVETEIQVPLRRLAERLDDLAQSGAPSGLARAELEIARDEIRDLASGLYPSVLAPDGLAAALRELAGRSPLPVELRVADGITAGPDADATVYFVCAETLANAVRHARASRVVVVVARDGGSIAASIEDDGVGGADLDAGSGLRGLRDRVEALDGTLAITSTPGLGTRLAVTIPVGHEARSV
jgi:hypothetical protein